MKTISKRDLKIFILGFLSFLVINIIYDWEGHKESAIRGWNDAKMGKPFHP
ncbi:hypothetical protein [Psychroflexus sediminis]|uniref:Uncharacterized protein n=1 Tax=Psychroflexus sediminis TaxID=470826 RepID=A0A1G7W910_9FLAO|nr:hypothetical protein [Psychroflexus sediminis]SDG68437.1 hypothetical protein SAMN04488027_10572 [Psychroflexus sediminis]